MGKSLTRRILESHAVEGEWIPGDTLAVRVHQVLTHDLLGPLVFLQFAALGLPRFKVELAATYADHSVFQTDSRMTRDHHFIRTASRKFGAYYSRPGAGICHQVHLERFAVPGKVLLGSDSHTPTAGGLGMIAIGAGGLDVTAALAGGPYRLAVPRVTSVRLTGALRPWVTAKDVILELIRRTTVKGGVGHIFEFTGPGIRHLTVPERATLTNMSAEFGATTAIFPSDEATLDYLRRAGRESAWTPLEADPDAEYDGRIEIDLTQVEPLVACPSMPDRVVPARELRGLKVDQVIVGSCTNGSYVDILQVAQILDGRAVHPDVELVINPSSKQSAELLAREGWTARLMATGANLSESTCGPCIGLAHIPAQGSVSLRTFNRNFRGRSGLKDDRVYLSSPVVAAIAAVTGEIQDPEDWAAAEARRGEAPVAPGVHLPERFNLSSHDIVPPASEDEARAITLPITDDMVALPPLDPLPEHVSARVVGVFGDDITTDDISPASSEALAAMTNLPLAAGFTFAGLDPGFIERAKAAGVGVIVAGRNYGQGSSRENSAIAPRYLGVRVVIARSFARIHRANLINWGILPFMLAEEEETARETTGRDPALGDVIEFSDVRGWLIRSGPAPRGGRSPVYLARNARQESAIQVQHDLSKRELYMVLSGGLFSSLKADPAA